MKLEELLDTIGNLAKAARISEPFIVGGFPRDRALGLTAVQTKDLDLTTGDKNSFALALMVSKQWPDAPFQTYDDGHYSINFTGTRIDLSNNFILPNIENELIKYNIDKPTSLQKELYSRDFTINLLLQPMDLTKKPLDLTGKAFDDIKAKRLRTPVDPELTIGYDARRILRAIKLAIQFDLEIDKDLGEAMIKYRGMVGHLPAGHVRKQVNQMFKMDVKKAIQLLSEYKLLPIIPLSRLMAMEMAKHHMVQHLFDGGL